MYVYVKHFFFILTPNNFEIRKKHHLPILQPTIKFLNKFINYIFFRWSKQFIVHNFIYSGTTLVTPQV